MLIFVIKSERKKEKKVFGSYKLENFQIMLMQCARVHVVSNLDNALKSKYHKVISPD